MGVRRRFKDLLYTLALALNPGFHREPQSTEGMAAFFRYQVGALVQIAESALGEGAGQALAHWIQFVQCQESTNPWTKYQGFILVMGIKAQNDRR